MRFLFTCAAVLAMPTARSVTVSSTLSAAADPVKKSKVEAAKELQEEREANAKMANELDEMREKASALREKEETSSDKLRKLNAQMGYLATEGAKKARQNEMQSLQDQYDNFTSKVCVCAHVSIFFISIFSYPDHLTVPRI